MYVVLSRAFRHTDVTLGKDIWLRSENIGTNGKF